MTTDSRPHREGRRRRLMYGALAVLLILGCGFLLFRGCGSGQESWPCMVSAKAKKAAYAQMRREGVKLTIQEPAGVDRKAEPVTSGVPLPEGCVKDVTKLCLVAVPSSDSKTSAKGECRAVPCQFTPQCRWPDGSIKWVLLDFQADVGASNKVEYVLKKGGNSPKASHMVNVSPVADLREVGIRGLGPRLQGLVLDAGPLWIGIATNVPGLIHSIVLDGKEIVSPTNPVQVVLVDGSNRVFRASRPDGVTVETQGPIRTTVRVSGRFVADDAPVGAAHTGGATILDGKVGYDLRVTAYAGKSYLKLDFTLKNDGWYGYRNEHRPRQWLYFRSLRLDVPVAAASSGDVTARLSAGESALKRGQSATLGQWYKYPTQNVRRLCEEVFRMPDELARENPSGMREVYKGYYWWLETPAGNKGAPGKTAGWAEIQPGQGPWVGMATRRFWQDFPRGLTAESSGTEAGPCRLSFLMFPEGGFWPRTQAAYRAKTYQFEGGRRKTAEVLLWFGVSGKTGEEIVKALDQPLFARADTEWYRDTGAVVPLAKSGLTATDPELAEAMERYDRLQRAKVKTECGDLAEPNQNWALFPPDKISIATLWDWGADVHCGWMNYGDLLWDFGYCSLYYQWPYSMLQQYLRLGDREFLDVGEDMIRHRYDIDQYHVEKTEPYLGGFQRYEKGEHGHLSRQDENPSWEKNANPSHTWNRCLLLHWALRGDPRSLEAALENGRAYQRFFYAGAKMGEKKKVPYEEFRTPVWAMDNWLALYEYTGDTNGLKWANEVFDKTLLAMERDNGSCGHITKEGKQSSQFTAYMVEPVCRLHHLTGRRDAIEFLKRVLDWERKAAAIRGMEKDGNYFPTAWRVIWTSPPPEPDVNMPMGYRAIIHYSYQFCDGYAYLHHVLGDEEDRVFARKIFREIVFYSGFPDGCPRTSRTRLGYHNVGEVFGVTPKVHAFSGRYAQLFLSLEETPEWRQDKTFLGLTHPRFADPSQEGISLRTNRFREIPSSGGVPEGRGGSSPK